MSLQLVRPEKPAEDSPKLTRQLAGAIILIGRSIVLVRPKPIDLAIEGKTETLTLDEWLLPKGHVEEGESLIQAAIREAKEETGFTIGVESDQPIITTRVENEKEIQEIHWFEARGIYMKSEDQTDVRHIGIFPALVALAKLTYFDQRSVIATLFSGEKA